MSTPRSSKVTPARLDADGSAKPLTEIVAVMPEDKTRGYGTIHAGQATSYIARPTDQRVDSERKLYSTSDDHRPSEAPLARKYRPQEAPNVGANPRDHYKDLWEKSCQAVSELCDLAGAKPEDMHDLWTLKILIEELRAKSADEECDCPIAPPDGLIAHASDCRAQRSDNDAPGNVEAAFATVLASDSGPTPEKKR